jgi:PAS domain S-box-containing protein
VTLQQDENFFELANDSVMTRTMEGVINFWNRSAERLYGWKKEEAIGKISHNLLHTQFPKPLEEIESELVQKGRWEGKLLHTTRNGDRVLVISRWTLDHRKQPEAIVEINAPSSDNDTDPEARTDSNRVESGRQQPSRISKLMTDDLLPKIANIVLAGGAFVCIFVLMYFIYYYGWTAQRHVSGPFGMVLYCIFPAVLSSILFGFLQRSPEFKVNAAMVCVSVAVSVYAAELLLTFATATIFPPEPTLWGAGHFEAGQKKQIVTLAKKSGIDFDFRSRFEVVMDLRKQDIGAVPSFIPLGLLREQADGSFKSDITIDGAEVLPLNGISNRVTVLCNETGKYAIYDSDERGFHNPKGTWESSRMSIAALGDSFTIGACVPSDENFVALIRARYPNTLNLGMLGEGPLIMLAALKEYLPPVKPKVVLWFFYEENDFTDLLKEANSALLRRYLQDDFKQELFSRQTDIDQALIDYIENAIKTAEKNEEQKIEGIENASKPSETLKNFLKLTYLRQTLGAGFGRTVQTSELPEYSEAQLDLFRNVLLQAKMSVGTWGGVLYFVYLPGRDRYAYDLDYNRKSILSIVRGLDLPIIDLSDSFQLRGDPLRLFPFGRFGHYNEEGHRLVAKEVLRSIESKHPN